jgi:hypothetical protein
MIYHAIICKLIRHTQCLGVYLFYPVPGGNKYWNLALQVGGAQK